MVEIPYTTNDLNDLGLPANNPDLNTLIDTAYISQVTPQGYSPIGEYERQLIENNNIQLSPQEIGPQGINALYPGISQPINVGTSSGQITGSHGVYVPSGNIMAIDPVLARRKAIDDAARLRAAQLKPYTPPQTPILKDPRFQQKLNQDVSNTTQQAWNDAVKKYGAQNARTILTDPNTEEGRKLTQSMANYEFLAKNLDNVTEMVAVLDKGLQDKSIYLPPQTLKKYSDYKQMLGSFGDYDVVSEKDFSLMSRQLKGAADFNNYLNTSGILKTLEPTITSNYRVNEAGDIFKATTGEKTSWSEVAKDVAKELARTTFAPEVSQGIYDEKFFQDAIAARLKDQYKQTGTFQQKSKAILDNEGAVDINPWQEGVSVNSYSENAPKNVQYYNYDPKTGRRESQFGLDFVKDYNIAVKGKKQTVNERTAEGRFVQQESRGIPISGLEIKTEKGVRTIPGTALAEFYTMRKDKNGDVYQDAKVWVPTKVPAVDAKGELLKRDGEQVYTDGYTVEEVAVLIYEKGKGGTGTATKIQNSIQDSDQKKNYIQGFKNMQEEDRRTSSQEKSTEAEQYGL